MRLSLAAAPFLLSSSLVLSQSLQELYATSSAATFAIKNVYIFDGTKFSSAPRSLISRDGLITSETLSTNSTPLDYVYDGGRQYLLPGLIDTHVHVPSAPMEHLIGMRSQGITTAFDQACVDPDGQHHHCGLRNLAGNASTPLRNSTRETYPWLFLSYVPAVSRKTRHAKRMGKSSAVSTPSDIDAWLAARGKEAGPHVKVILTYPDPSLEVSDVQQIVAGAHGMGKVVICHASTHESADVGAEGGCDQLHHVPMDRAADEGLVAKIKSKGIPVAPTLTQMRGIAGEVNKLWSVWLKRMFDHYVLRKEWKTTRYELAEQSARALARAGVPILVGTDASGEDLPVIGTVDFQTGFGTEIELLKAAGVAELDIVRGATSMPARYFNLPDRGLIAPGRRADLVLLGGNPLEDVAALRDVRRVWIGGRNHENLAQKTDGELDAEIRRLGVEPRAEEEAATSHAHEEL